MSFCGIFMCISVFQPDSIQNQSRLNASDVTNGRHVTPEQVIRDRLLSKINRTNEQLISEQNAKQCVYLCVSVLFVIVHDYYAVVIYEIKLFRSENFGSWGIKYDGWVSIRFFSPWASSAMGPQKIQNLAQRQPREWGWCLNVEYTYSTEKLCDTTLNDKNA